MQIRFLQKKPFFIFEIENFLSDTEYEIFSENFPNIDKEKLKANESGKYRLMNSDDQYKLLQQNGNECIEILEKKFNDTFFLDLKKKVKKEIFLSRLSKPLDIFSLFRKTKIVKKITNKNFLQKILYSTDKYSFEFSYMFKNSYIYPHSDSQSKLLSLMLYFPTKNLENQNIGTTFYNTKIKNFENKQPDYFDENFSSFFKENFQETLTLPFKKKNLYCFIKSEVSWHSVKKLNIPENEIRKSININLNI